MARIEELLETRHDDKIDYDALLNEYPWIVERDRSCVLSPDSDGLLCGLFMSKVLNWKIVGFYDDKVAVINNDFVNSDVVFLDGEIYRKEIKSFGHHMVLWNKNHKHASWDNFNACIQPNNLREYDGNSDFRLKYPLATIHMLVSIVAYKKRNIKIPKSSIAPLFFTDGVFNNLFSYPENVLNWLKYLRINEDWNPLKKVFENKSYSPFELMNKMNEFFRERDKISEENERGDKLRISKKDGTPHNIVGYENNTNNVHLNENAVDRIKKFLDLLSNLTKWKYVDRKWKCWENLKYYKFTKGSFKGDKKTLTIQNFNNFLDKNPLSWAMTSGNDIEYTLEEPSFLEINRAINDYVNFYNEQHKENTK